MTNNIKVFLTTMALLFSSQTIANQGCGFDAQADGQQENNSGLIATCKEEVTEVILTGNIQAQTLVTQLDEFSQSYKEYQVDTTALAPLANLTEPTEIVVIIGTWCGDCHRETPRFIRIIEALNNPNIKVTYISVDRNKVDPENLAANYEFTRIPTFIVSQKGVEIGRIIERPEVSLESDLVKILI